MPNKKIIKIRMVSGKEYVFSTDKYKTIEEWIMGNFRIERGWFKIGPDYDFVIFIQNIEEIQMESEA